MDRYEIEQKYGCGLEIATICANDGIEPVKLGCNNEPGEHRLTLFAVGEREAIATNGNSIWDSEDGFDAVRAAIMDEPEETPAREIEVCSNPEWWRVMGPAGDIEDDDGIREMIDDIHNALRDLGHEPSAPHGQRILLHGWNGAHSWARRGPGVCTFCHFKADEWKAVDDAVDAVIDRHCAKARQAPPA